jgi:hypothetical protein
MGDLVAKAKKDKKILNLLLLGCIGLVELILLILVIVITSKAMGTQDANFIYKMISINILLIWIGVLIGYYTWVIYFFNINLGLTNEDWAEIREKEQNGEPVEVRKENPHGNQTLGLPEGTIRGTLALSLAVGAMAMLVASLGIDHTMSANELFIDTFDFFKTAFLMMIAFYFGNKSLQYLNLNPVKGGKGQAQTTDNSPTLSELKPTLAPAVDPDVAGVRAQLMDEKEGPDDVAKDKSSEGAFDKPNANG